VSSGIGFVDIVLFLSKTPHLIELKILTDDFAGPEQLASYMAAEGRNEGWLIVFDARAQDKRTAIPTRVSHAAGTIKVIQIEINPIPPSARNRKAR
jgi:hypothetical protein